MTESLPRLLLVDDEPQVIDGIVRRLRREYQIFSALDGVQALKLLEHEGEMHIIVSDMRMPIMDGAALLTEARKQYPDMIRILLTGQADLASAVSAVNDGQIFRFLLKPCPTDVLRAQLQAALAQHDLVHAERVLLQQTLSGAIHTLSEVLSLAMPEAFGRATRIKQRAKALVEAIGITDSWRIEVAATLSQLGAVTLRADTVSRLYHGQPLSEEERAAAARLPSIAVELLKPIPRLQIVCELITQGFSSEHATGVPSSLEGQALRLCNDYDTLCTGGMSRDESLGSLHKRGFDAKLFEAFSLLTAGENAAGKLKDVSLLELRVGMVLAEDIYTSSGTLLLARGNTIRANVIERLRAMRSQLGPRTTLRVRVPD
jgi:response regulator RpfG family c-di-GMP phosphodiesterase